ncbi:MAG: Gldg family protein [Candidatus Acidiferrales bacterium]
MKLDRNEIARFVVTLGIAMLIASFIRYYIQGELLTFSKGLLIAGAVCVVAALVIGFRGVVDYLSKRSTKQGSNTLVLTLAVLAILVIANLIGYRHPKRIDLTTEKLYTLSDQTRNVVQGLKQDVTIIRFDKTPSESFDDLMNEYKHLSPHIQARSVDPNQKPDVAAEYGATQMGDVVVASGNHKQHVDVGFGSGISEQDITPAIIKVISDKVKTVCFITGHGERSISDSSPQGFSQADDGLKKENYATKTINLITDNGIPSDCSVVVDGGPVQGLFPQEVALIGKYLDGGGDTFILLDAQTDPKLADLFGAWNIVVGDNVVLDASGVGQLIGAGPAIPVVTDFGASPITKGFQGSLAFFPLARTVSIADKAKTVPTIVQLLKTTARSFTVPKLDKTMKDISFNPATAGPLSLGVSAERKADSHSARLVVIGNTAFAQNSYLSKMRNGDLFDNAIDWLAQDENLISIRPKSPTNRSVTLTETQTALLKWLDIIFIPGLVIISGIYIWWRRR